MKCYVNVVAVLMLMMFVGGGAQAARVRQKVATATRMNL